jgi:hypothetical protein
MHPYSTPILKRFIADLLMNPAAIKMSQICIRGEPGFLPMIKYPEHSLAFLGVSMKIMLWLRHDNVIPVPAQFNTLQALHPRTVGFYLHEAFERQGRYLNFSAWLMKNVLFKRRKIKLWNKRHGEVKRDCVQCLNEVKSPVVQRNKINPYGCFFRFLHIGELRSFKG